MSSWRFRRSSAPGSLPEATHTPSRQPLSGVNANPPRYSNLTSLAEPSEASPIIADYAERVPSRLSTVSLGSQLSPPSYRTNDPETLSIRSSTVILTNPPPRYSSLSQNAQAARGGAGFVERDGPIMSGYTFDIATGFKSERWATLRLYDGKSSSRRGTRKGRHPRFSDTDTMLGRVELRVPSSQTIKSIELTLKGYIITGAVGDGASTSFLEQGYILWDRKFGDPRLLTHDPTHDSSKYDGKLSGNWIFPFSIPFPTHVNIDTLRAVYLRECEAPVRFLPERLNDDDRPSTPFDLGGGSAGKQSDLHSAPAHPFNITPFDMGTPSMPTEKGGPVLPRNEPPVRASTLPPTFAPIPPSHPTASSTPILEPYPLHTLEATTRPSPSFDPVRPTPAIHASGFRKPKGATGMQGPQLPTSTNGHPLPQSFLERDVVASIQYELTLTITHGWFSTRNRTPVIYTPITIPPSIMPGRRRAYRQREMPQNPDLDPDSWKQLSPVSIRGTFSDRTTLTISYSLCLAAPLSYTRVIPCYLTVSCDDPSALNLFADPRTPRVRLRRSIRFLHNQADDDEQAVGPSWKSDVGSLANNIPPNKPRLSRTSLLPPQRKQVNQIPALSNIDPFIPVKNDVEEETLASSDEANAQDIGDGAVWCVPANFVQATQVRRLYGEIHLPRGLQGTCKFPLFNILYHVELLAPTTNAFVPDMQSKPPPRKGKSQATVFEKDRDNEHVYVSQAIEIATDARKDEPLTIAFIGDRYKEQGVSSTITSHNGYVGSYSAGPTS